MQVLKIVWVHCSMVRVNLMFKRDLGAILIWQPKERRYVAVINTDFVIEVLQTLSKNTTATATATRTWQNKRSEQWPCTCVLKLCTFLSRPYCQSKPDSWYLKFSSFKGQFSWNSGLSANLWLDFATSMNELRSTAFSSLYFLQFSSALAKFIEDEKIKDLKVCRNVM